MQSRNEKRFYKYYIYKTPIFTRQTDHRLCLVVELALQDIAVEVAEGRRS